MTDNSNTPKLNPECYNVNFSSYLKADGTYFPCCYVSTDAEFRNFLGEDLYKQLNISQYTLQEIQGSEAWKKLYNSIQSDQPLKTCLKFCKYEKNSYEDGVGNKLNALASSDKGVTTIPNMLLQLKKYSIKELFSSDDWKKYDTNLTDEELNTLVDKTSTNDEMWFHEDYKLYAYKKYDICDLSIRINFNFVLTFRLTHNELRSIFKGAYTKPGIRVKLSTGAYIYAVIKPNLNIVRFTISAHSCNYNIRLNIGNFEDLIRTYVVQMNSPQAWDDYDPR